VTGLPIEPAPYGWEHQDLDGKIVAALERVAQSLRVLLWQEAREHDLTPLQLRILVHLLTPEEERRRASAIAREFGLTRATVGEAVATLETKGMLRRLPCPHDARSQDLRLTPLGEAVARKAAGWGEAVRRALADMASEERATALRFLLSLIAALQRAGIVQVARICFTCRFFHEEDGRHFCRLLEAPLPTEALRLDCPDHQSLPA